MAYSYKKDWVKNRICDDPLRASSVYVRDYDRVVSLDDGREGGGGGERKRDARWTVGGALETCSSAG